VTGSGPAITNFVAATSEDVDGRPAPLVSGTVFVRRGTTSACTAA
jgi:hypothetical protein